MVDDDLADRLSGVEAAAGDGDAVPFACRQPGTGRLVNLKTGEPVQSRDVIFTLPATVVDNWTDAVPFGGDGRDG